MNALLRKELPLLAIIALPIAYAAYLWNTLPNKVPLHWNIKGEVDRYGDKSELLVLVLLPLFIYLLLLIIPKIDPKNKLHKMGNKYQSIKFVLTAFMSALALFIIYVTKNASFMHPNGIAILIGLMFIIFGNYFKTIKSNYFIGIRTPWTLENEIVWKETHRIGGVLWFAGGLLIIISSLIFPREMTFTLMLIITAIIVIVPVVYSYVKFREVS